MEEPLIYGFNQNVCGAVWKENIKLISLCVKSIFKMNLEDIVKIEHDLFRPIQNYCILKKDQIKLFYEQLIDVDSNLDNLMLAD